MTSDSLQHKLHYLLKDASSSPSESGVMEEFFSDFFEIVLERLLSACDAVKLSIYFRYLFHQGVKNGKRH